VVQHQGEASISFQVTSPPDLGKWQIAVPLTLRTNMAIFALSAKTSERMNISIGSPKASGNGEMLAPGALSSFVGLSTVLESESLIAKGTRISRRGNNNCPDNALVAELIISSDSFGKACASSCSVVIYLR
jgi:hypothetical protein